MKVVFRADASSHIGTGHVMRCLTLAEELRSRGVEVSFICRDHPGNLAALLGRRGISVTLLPAPDLQVSQPDDYAAWLGVPQMQDAEQTIDALQGTHPQWLIVDHYGLDAEWEQRLRPHCAQLMVVDDLVNRRHECDALLNQNFSDLGPERYRGLVPDSCRLLLGPRYALLRPEYAMCRKMIRSREGDVRRVLVYFGGSDPHDLTVLALQALSAPQLCQLTVDVVIGPNYSNRTTLERLASARGRTILHDTRPHLADLMMSADLACGAGGATTWERMCLGLPTALISIADNQRPACEALARAELAYYAADFTQVRVENLRQALEQSLADPQGLRELAARSQHAVDGLGTLRIAEMLVPTAIEHLRLVQEENATPTQSVERRMLALKAGSLPIGHVQLEIGTEEVAVECRLDESAQDDRLMAYAIAMTARYLQQASPRMLHSGKSVGTRFMRFTSARADGYSIAIVSDRGSWINEYLPKLVCDWLGEGHRVLWTHDPNELRSGDFCFYLSCGRIVPAEVLARFRHNLVVHESELPQGKGWSPLTWQVLEGKERIPVTLFEAADKVDSGVIYAQQWLSFEGHELIAELRAAQATVTRDLCRRFVSEYPAILREARVQVGEESFYKRRTPADSRLDPTRSVAEQFSLLRVVDNERYPAFFEHRDHVYTVSIQKMRKHRG